MPSLLDGTCVVLFVVVATFVEHSWFWPRFRAGVAAGEADARIWGYRRVIVAQWAFAVAIAAIWRHYDRSLADLALTAPTGWRLIASGVVVALTVAFGFYQLAAIRKMRAARPGRNRPKLGALAFILPHTRTEHRWFLLLSLTAGICEEVTYRGYLVWFLRPSLGPVGAYVGVVVLFGIGHLYQGRQAATRATMIGAVMTGVVALTGWLIPVMIIHTLIDAGSGTAAYLLLRDDQPIPETATGRGLDEGSTVSSRSTQCGSPRPSPAP